MIDGSGLSDTTLTFANVGSVTHNGVVDGNAWVTTSNAPDFFSGRNNQENPTIEFDLDTPQTLTGFVYWGYQRSNGSDLGNEAKDFTVSLRRTAGPNRVFSFSAESPTGLNSREFSFPAVEDVDSIAITITDNFFEDDSVIGEITPNGNRVGLSEIRFINRPQVIVTTLDDEDDGQAALGMVDDISLREAINHAPNDALIVFSSDLNGGTITLTGENILVSKSLTIDASSLPGGLTVDGEGRSRHFRIVSGNTLTLRGLTLTRGSTAINTNGSSAGGSILNSGTLNLSACTLTGNSSNGGGGAIENNGTCSIVSSTLSDNTANFGGAISNSSGTCSIVSSTLSDNTANNGGAIFNGGTCSIVSSTISNNTANNNGGAIQNNGTCSIVSSTLSNNSSGTSGGGIANFSSLELQNSIVAGNTAPEGANVLNNGGNFTGTDNLLEGDPRLSPLGDYGGATQTMHPLAGSPAILTGDDVARTDQRGFNLTGPPTIGAVKLGAVTVVSNQAALRAAIESASETPGRIIRIASSLTSMTFNTSQFTIPGTANGLFLEAPGLTIDVNGQSRVMEIQPGATAALHGLTLTGGFSSGNGGAILNNQATLSLSACTLSGNSAGDNGGGIFSDGRNGSATLSLSSCTLSGNSAVTGGGGIFSTGGDEGSATLSLSACTLSGNSARIYRAAASTATSRGITAARR